jgi:hypothetical protein
MASMLFESVSEYEVSSGSGELRNTRAPKIWGLQQSVKEEEFGRGLAWC